MAGDGLTTESGGVEMSVNVTVDVSVTSCVAFTVAVWQNVPIRSGHRKHI